MPANMHEFTLPIRTEQTLRKFVHIAFGAKIPDRVVVPGHSTPWRAFSDAYFARSRVSVWKASRGFGGKSFLLALLGLTEALTLGADVKILGGSGAQSKNVQDYVSEDFFLSRNCPRHMWNGEPLTTISRFRHGNTIQALLASSKSIRGPHPQRLRLDEVDEMALPLFDAAMGQTMSKVQDGAVLIPAQTVASSTHHYPDKTMTEILKRARDRDWSIHEWGWQETSAAGGWLLPSEVAAKRSEVTQAMWEIEYDLQEPVAEGRAIITDNVRAMFDAGLGTFAGAAGRYLEFEAPEKGARYVTGADWAKENDWTVILTMRVDVYPYRVVAFERRRREQWPKMVGRYDKRCQRYRGKNAHDKTGIGSVVHDYSKSPGHGVLLTGARRKSIFSNYVAAIEDDAIVCPNIEWMRGEHEYVKTDDLFGSGHPPDSIVAGALCYLMATRGGGGRGT